jgi:hypothetical protein
MILEVHMSPWQYRDGYAERVAELLAEANFIGCPGLWRVKRKLAAIEIDRSVSTPGTTIEVRRVTFELEPLDAKARRIEAAPDSPEAE